MATKTATKAAAPLEDPAPPPPAPPQDPRASAHPPASDYQTLWVFHEDVLAVQGQTGWVLVLKSNAQALIDAGHAVDPYNLPDGMSQLPYIEERPPVPLPVAVSITAFSAANPTIATASSTDTAKLANADKLRLQSTAGDTAARAAIDGKVGTVANKGGINFDLTGVDLSAATVAGLTAIGTVQAPAPAPAQPPAPPPPPPPPPPPAPAPAPAPAEQE